MAHGCRRELGWTHTLETGKCCALDRTRKVALSGTRHSRNKYCCNSCNLESTPSQPFAAARAIMDLRWYCLIFWRGAGLLSPESRNVAAIKFDNVDASWARDLGHFLNYVPTVVGGLFMSVDLQMIIVSAGYLALHLANRSGMSIRYLRLMNVLRPAKARLDGIVNEVAVSADVSVRSTWQFGGMMANTFAFSLTCELAFSDRLLADLQ